MNDASNSIQNHKMRTNKSDVITIIDISSDSESSISPKYQDGPVHHGEACANEGSPTTHCNDSNVHQFMEITGISCKQVAQSQLSRFGNDLNRSISVYFGEEDNNGRTNNINSKSCGKLETKRSDSKTLSQPGIPKLGKKNDENMDAKINTFHQPSSTWDKAIKNCKGLNVKFIDEEFPPDSSSIDGRKESKHSHRSGAKSSSSSSSSSKGSNKEQTIIKCKCGLPAKIRTVQKDGPNYGRFFLSCGKDRPRIRKSTKRNNKRKRDNNNNETDSKDGDDDLIIIDIDDIDDIDTTSQNTVKPKAATLPKTDSTQCSFFQWDDKHKQTSLVSAKSAWVHQLEWIRYENKDGFSFTYPRGQYSPDHVRQGLLGDCWFLSALAVVAERPYLIQRLVPHLEFNEYGCYEVFFCCDGSWNSVLVDSLLPSIPSKRRKEITNTATTTFLLNDDIHDDEGQSQSKFALQPAFASGNVIWPSIVEKGYAKVHGSYSRLSGGFISEAFYDLTGTPVERIHFHSEYDYEGLFARLLSFVSAGFLMGIATNRGGDGLIPCHAYSILGLYEIYDAVEGSQSKLTQYVTKKSDSDDIEVIEHPSCITNLSSSSSNNNTHQKKTIRLVCIRNPWGVREWKGKWSVNSDSWTRKIRKELGAENLSKQGNGTFYMSYEDMIQRFDHLDVAKCKEGWFRNTLGGVVKYHETGDALLSSPIVYTTEVHQRTWGFISFVQKKKRANTTTRFWYTDVSMIVLRRKGSQDAWEMDHVRFQGVKRFCDVELFLDSGFEYCFIPFSYLCGQDEPQSTTQVSSKKSALIRITSYAGTSIKLTARRRNYVCSNQLITILHTSLLKETKKLIYCVGPHSILVAVSCIDCIYFIGLNSSSSEAVWLKLTIDASNRNMKIAQGQNGDTHIIEPESQSIILVVANDGRYPSNDINFFYLADTCKTQKLSKKSGTYTGITSKVDLSLLGELLCNESQQRNNDCTSRKGKGTINKYLWAT